MLPKTGILYFTALFHGFDILRRVDPFVRMLHICLVASGECEPVTLRSLARYLTAKCLTDCATHVENFIRILDRFHPLNNFFKYTSYVFKIYFITLNF